MAETKWDDLQMDCLVKIFTKLETEEIVESVQFVCKSWYQATLDPQCWQTLTFSERSCSLNFVKFAVRRSQGSATVFICRPRSGVTPSILIYISQNCLKLQGLILPYNFIRRNDDLIKDLIHNWKDLKCLKICECDYYGDILESISTNCKDFNVLYCPDTFLGIEEASLIVKFIPKIKSLRMRCSTLPRESLVMILEGCKELEFVEVSDCTGFDEMDVEIKKLASNIAFFDASRSITDGYYDFDNNFVYDYHDYDYDYNFDYDYYDTNRLS